MTAAKTSKSHLNEIYNRVVRPRDLREDDALTSDASLDSLKLVEFIVEVEDDFDIDLLSQSALRDISTFGDFVQLVDGLIDSTEPTAR